MQTFLPSSCFVASARLLDRQRLGKQRVECKQILTAIETGKGWANHPAVKQWRGYRGALILYAIAICREWRARGYKDTLLGFFLDKLKDLPDEEIASGFPWWLKETETREAFTRSHRSNLKRKMPSHYDFPDVPDNLPYVWPV